MGGASGNGYMSEREFQRGLAELKTLGSFKDGVFTREKPGGGKINQDAYEAVWEHVNQRELVYPKERYTRAVFMEPENFAWVPSGPGLATKLMGVFNERGTKIAFHRLDAGAKLKLDRGQPLVRLVGLRRCRRPSVAPLDHDADRGRRACGDRGY